MNRLTGLCVTVIPTFFISMGFIASSHAMSFEKHQNNGGPVNRGVGHAYGKSTMGIGMAMGKATQTLIVRCPSIIRCPYPSRPVCSSLSSGGCRFGFLAVEEEIERHINEISWLPLYEALERYGSTTLPFPLSEQISLI
jgi:hypothetical protein